MKKSGIHGPTSASTIVLLLLAVAGCGQKSAKESGQPSPKGSDRRYVTELISIADATINRERLSGLSIQQVARQYFEFSTRAKAIGTAGVSDELVVSVHGWADACARLTQAIDDALALPGDDAAVADGIIRLMLGEQPQDAWERASRHQADSDRAMRSVFSANDAIELRKSDFARAVTNLGLAECFAARGRRQ